ncbi:MAG: Bpu10I family restriction endonuclease [Armatimonadetes bacterium]|nr:Bpu10I family restriction endonuclease [Armatimonadota bacterium]
MSKTPHKDKIVAAIDNPKMLSDKALLEEALVLYGQWDVDLKALTSNGQARVTEMTRLLNEYKDALEVDLILKRGSPELKRQKGQLKLDGSVMEEFLIHLVASNVLTGLPDSITSILPSLEVEPRTAFMTFSFRPSSVLHLMSKPEIAVKTKDQDFSIGKTIHYKMSPNATFPNADTRSDKLFLSLFSAEMKVNLDKTMFQECCGTATRLKQGCPSARYYVLAEYLDMEPEDCSLTDIDNVFLLRHAKRLPSDRRSDVVAVENQRRNHPIDSDVIYRFVQEIERFLKANWYNPTEALRRGSFV